MPVPLRTSELWARLPIDISGPEEVIVVCMDATGEDFVLEIKVLTSCTLDELRQALVKQHLPNASKEQARRVRLAKRVGRSASFMGVDGATPLGELRSIHAMGLRGVYDELASE